MPHGERCAEMIISAIVWPEAGSAVLRRHTLPDPGPGEVVIETVLSVISPGTESEWLRSDESHFVLGTTFPFVPGYSRIGRIAALGEGVSAWQIGERVVAAFDNLGRPLGAHASHSLVRASDLDLIPDGVSFEQASLFLLGQTAFFTTSLAEVGEGDSIVIVGAGPIGNLAVQFARAMGSSSVVALDLVAERRARAIAAGATEAMDPADHSVMEALARRNIRKVIDLSGNPLGTNTAIELAGSKATIVLSTGFGGQMTLNYGQIFMKALHLIGGYVNSDPDLARRGTRAYLEHVADGRLDVRHVLTTGSISPEQAPDVFQRILAGDRTLGAPIIRWAND